MNRRDANLSPSKLKGVSMCRVSLSWPAKAVALAASAIWVVGVAHAAPGSRQTQSEPAMVGGWDMFPAGTIPVPPKPKASEEGDAGLETIPSGSIPIPPKPKGSAGLTEDGDAGLDAYPTGTIPVPPKPKAREEGDIGLDAYPAGTIPIPPKPKSNIQY